MHTIHAMSAEKLTVALGDGIIANNPATDLAAVEAELGQFLGLIATGGKVKEAIPSSLTTSRPAAHT